MSALGDVLGSYVESGDRLFLIYTASATPNFLSGYIDVENKNGKTQPYEVRIVSFLADRSHQLNEALAVEIEEDGKIVGGGIAVDRAVIKRGDCYATLFIQRRLGIDLLVAKGYADNIPIGLGETEDSMHGAGRLGWRTVVADVTPVDVTVALAALNTRRKIYGFVWYYHASSDVADRLLRVFIQAPGISLPTGFSISESILPTHSSPMGLSANEEGILYSYKSRGGEGVSARSDNGVLASEVTTADPQIWPIDVVEDDRIKLFFDVADAEAADRHSIFILQEEWIEP